MDFKEYQEKAVSTAIYPACGVNPDSPSVVTARWIYPAIGLGGEAGEILEKIKKLIRDKNGNVEDSDRASIRKEIGDVLWYLAALSKEFDISLDDAARENLEKLFSRKERGVLGGSGDNR